MTLLPLKLSQIFGQKRMPGEKAKDSKPPDPITRFRVEVCGSVIDQITSSLKERFTVNRAIILDASCLDPRRFKELRLMTVEFHWAVSTR